MGWARFQNAENRILNATLEWSRSGQRGIGCPTRTLRREIENYMTEVAKTCNELKRLTQDRSEWQKHVCIYALQVAGSKEGDTLNVHRSPSPRRLCHGLVNVSKSQ